MESKLQFGNKTLEYVSAVAKYASFSQAAKVLYISQPALSKYIRNLEVQIGAPLFYRQNGKVIPTYIGERMLYYANQIIPLEQEMEQALVSMSAGSGRIRLALPHLWSSLLLPDIIEKLRDNFPDMELIIDEVSSSDKLEDMILNREVDLAIMRSHMHSAKLTSEFLRKDEILLVLPKDHPLAGKAVSVPERRYPVIDPALLGKLSFILQRPSQIIRKKVDRIFEEAGVTPSVNLTLRSIEASIKLVQGNTACFGTETHVHNIANAEQYEFLCLDTPMCSLDLHLFFLNTDETPLFTRQVIHFLTTRALLAE